MSTQREVHSMNILILFAGFALLIIGAEAMVRGATRLAVTLGISPLVIGLTVVAYGTSCPELAVCVMSALSGKADIAIGNAVGSNILNTFFVLGISSIFIPLTITPRLIRLDVPLMIGVSILTLIFGINGRISRLEGIVLFAGVICYTFFSIYRSRQENREDQAEASKDIFDSTSSKRISWLVNTGFIIAGLGLLVLGSKWLVDSAVSIAQQLGVSELVIGLTIVAAGTSLPEVATSLVASIRKQRDIAVGNIVGSNIFNILMVLGVTGIVSPDGIFVSTKALHFDIPVMIAAAIICLPVFYSGYIISRWEGFLFLTYYTAYTVYLVLDVVHSPALPDFVKFMVWFYIPVTVLGLVYQAMRCRRLRNFNP